MEHTDQTIYDAYHMSEEEFVRYYRLYCQKNAEQIRSEREEILRKIELKKVEVVRYLDGILLTKSSYSRLELAFKELENDKDIDLGRCDSFSGKVVRVEATAWDEVLHKFDNRYDQVLALYHSGVTRAKEIADILNTNPSYVNRLLKQIKVAEC